MEKEFIVQLSPELFKVKTEIENELQKGNKVSKKFSKISCECFPLLTCGVALRGCFKIRFQKQLMKNFIL